MGCGSPNSEPETQLIGENPLTYEKAIDNSTLSNKKSDASSKNDQRRSDSASEFAAQMPLSKQQPRKPVRRNPQSQLFKLDENEHEMDYEQALEVYQDEYEESERVRKETSVLHMGLPDTSRSYCLPCQGDAAKDERLGIEVKLDIDVDSVDEEEEGEHIARLFE